MLFYKSFEMLDPGLLQRLRKAGYVHATGISYHPLRDPMTSVAICLHQDHCWKWGESRGIGIIVTADGQVWLRQDAPREEYAIILEGELRGELCLRGGGCPVPFSAKEIASVSESLAIRQDNPYKDILGLPTTSDYIPDDVAHWPDATLAEAVE
ncbi:MAG: hypothetical protein PHS53_04490 [Candidatus Pacebacteria bacterium]|nr:hypothetical protein [Candidatus Paceibacterota bacterium]